jgi:hypothetical protein
VGESPNLGEKEMAKQEVTAVQVQMAAAAGVTLLQVDDLAVPLKIAKSGALGVLEGMLQAIANGEVVLGPPPQENIGGGGPKPAMAPVETTPPQGDQDQNGAEASAADESGEDPKPEA